MSNYILTPNMALTNPIPSQETGPQWATDIYNSLTLVDQHNHAPGYGALIPSAGIGINAALSFANNPLTNAQSLGLYPQNALLSAATYPAVLYASSAGELYFNDANNNQVKITSGGSVNSSAGSISGMSGNVAVSYVGGSTTFKFQSDSTGPTAANIDVESIVLRNSSANSKGMTISPPAAMAADINVTLPNLPASSQPVSVDNTGAMSAAPLTVSQLAAAVAAALNPAGSILAYGGAAAPTGYLLCDGSSVLRASYADLFTAIGTAYGAADGTHFNLPDLRGKFLRGVSGASGNDPDSASRTAQATGGNTGNNVGSIQASQYESHSHTETVGTGGGGTFSAPQNAFLTSGTLSNTNTAGSGGSETRPINAYVNFIIKT